MTAEEFIKNNPFPKNGAEINDRLVKEIKDPSKKKYYKKNVYRLFKNNARIIFLVWKQYNYNQELSSIMSFVYEGIEKAANEYKVGSKKPFYSYAMTHIRGLLQNHYNYNESLIHIPVKKKKELEHDISDIDSIAEYHIHDESEYEYEENMIDFIFAEFEKQPISEKIKEDLYITKLAKTMSVNEIADETGLGVGKIRNTIKRTIPKLRKFYDNKLKDMV